MIDVFAAAEWASQMCGRHVPPATVRTWIGRALIQPAGRQGGMNLYDVDAIHALLVKRARK